MIPSSATLAHVGFAETDFLTLPRISQIIQHFGSLETAWACSEKQEFLRAGIPLKSVESFWRKRVTACPEKTADMLQKKNIDLIFYQDEQYPHPLKTIAAPPTFLFVQGNVSHEDALSLAVVGTRKVSAEGKYMTELLVPKLCHAGLTIISGLARGVDSIAHRSTLSAGGKTIAVLGNGIGDIYPSENTTLARNIIESGGAVISEFAPGVPPNAYNFPRRNRIVAGLTLGTLVIEGAEKSGSLITAQYALEQSREVFAVPGSPRNTSAHGPNRLIQRGEAKLILSSEDILAELPLEQASSQSEVQQSFFLSNQEQKVFDTLTSDPCVFDELARKSTISSAQFSAHLTLLEMKGYAICLGGNRWVRK